MIPWFFDVDEMKKISEHVAKEAREDHPKASGARRQSTPNFGQKNRANQNRGTQEQAIRAA